MTPSPELSVLLQRLLEVAGSGVAQHKTDPQPSEWFVGRGPYGDWGPFESAEDAVVGLVELLWKMVDEARADRITEEGKVERLRAEMEAMQLEIDTRRREVEQMQRVAVSWAKTALRLNRELRETHGR